MATEASLYDLVLLLDTAIEDERRDQILANVEHAVEGAGEIVGRHEWGVRPTAYEVHKHTDAEYHLLQFHGPPTLLDQLDHNLKITDGILRFRIIKLRPGTPGPPEMAAAVAAPAAAAPAAPAPAAPAPAAPAPAAPAPAVAAPAAPAPAVAAPAPAAPAPAAPAPAAPAPAEA